MSVTVVEHTFPAVYSVLLRVAFKEVEGGRESIFIILSICPNFFQQESFHPSVNLILL